MSSIVNEYKDDKEFLYSVLTDILMGDKSPNSKFIKIFILKTKINDDYLIERASLLTSYLKPEKYNDDYYDILRVNLESTQDEIREKWIKLAKEYHPDKIGDSGLEKIKRINEAYEVIGNKDKRLEYDSSYLDEIPVQVSASKAILPVKYAVYASTVVIFLLIAIFVKSMFFMDSENEIKIAKIYEDSNVKESYQTKINNEKSVQQSPEDVNIEELSDFSDISDVRKKRINEYLKNRTQTSSAKSELPKTKLASSLAPDTQSLTPNPSSPNPESKDPKLLALDKKINELEKSGDFKVIIVKSETPKSESIKSETPKSEIRNSDVPKTSSLAPNTESIKSEIPKSEIRNTDIPKTESSKTELASSLAPDTQSLTPNPSSLKPSIQSRKSKPDLPKSESRTSNPEIYTVKSGDNLWKIARKNDTRVKVIKELNNLKSNKLKLGQKLIIPSSLDSSWQLAVKNSDKPKTE